jgi:uncharacterized integral membrane protein
MEKMNDQKFVETLKAYLDNTQFPDGTHGGGEDTLTKSKKSEKETKSYLILDLQKIISSNNNWLKFLFGVIIALIIFIAVLIWRWQNNEKILFALLGGQGLSILFCLNHIIDLYKQKRTSEVLLHLFNSAQTAIERKKIIDDIVNFLTERKN